MNFLALAQRVARESGTVSGTLPSSVTGQNGRLDKIVGWTDQAWQDIQNARNAWRWMRADFEDTTAAGAGRYTAASFNLPRWAAWITEDDTVTLYKQATGVSDEGPLAFLPWDLFKRTFDRGEQTNDRPRYFSVSPAGEFCLGPTPDDTYVVRGEYRKNPQTLAANTDEPEMPARFHEAIVWGALILLAEHDEAQFHLATWTRRYRSIMGDLRRDQLPEITLGGPLA